MAMFNIIKQSQKTYNRHWLYAVFRNRTKKHLYKYRNKESYKCIV